MVGIADLVRNDTTSIPTPFVNLPLIYLDMFFIGNRNLGFKVDLDNGLFYKYFERNLLVWCLFRRFASSATNGATSRNNNTVSAGSRMPQRPRGRIVRAVGRGRGAGVIVGSRPLLPASVVPEELINQV